MISKLPSIYVYIFQPTYSNTENMLGRPFWIFGYFLFGIFCLCPNVLHDFANTYGRISFHFGCIFHLFYNVIKQIQIWKLERNLNNSCSDVLFLCRFVYKSKYKKCRYKKLFLFSQYLALGFY